jgi:acetyl esterase/lipase
MSIPMGYLVTTLLFAWCTFFALVAPRRPRSLGAMSFWFGMIPNEVPFLLIYWLLFNTAMAGVQGDLDSPGGMVAAGATAATAAGLAVCGWRGVRADRAVELALDQGLGTDWRDRVHTALPRHRPWGRILLRPIFVRRREVERIPDLRYGDAGRRNLLDVYRRRDAPQNGPVLVYFHGGGYTSGRKDREALPLLYRLAAQGWVCVSANYRLRPETQFPGHQIDAKKAIAWAREHAHEYGGDPSRLFVSGSSAGSNMAALCALTPNDPTFQPGFESADTSVTAAICLYGFYGFFYGPPPPGVRLPQSWPLLYIHPGAPPFFLAHGTRDALAPVEDARHFAERLRGTSDGTVVYAELPGGQHSFDLFHSPRFEAVVDGVEAFAARVLAEREPDGRAV